MAEFRDMPDLHPDDKRYSIVKMDAWKAPTDDDFAYKITEVDSVAEGPHTTAGTGESIIVLDQDGNTRCRSRTDQTEDGEETLALSSPAPTFTPSLDGNELIERARAAANSEKFERL